MVNVVLNFPAGSPLLAAFAQLGYIVQTPDEAIRSGSLSSALVAVSDFRRMAKDFHTAVRLGRIMSRAGVPHVYWNREGPSHFGEKPWRLWILRHGARMDAYAAHALQNCKGFARDVLYLPNAADTERYHLHGATLAQLRDSSRYRHDVSFFGTLDHVRYTEAGPRARFLAALAVRLRQLGISLEIRPDAMNLSEQIALIQSSRINLSIHSGADTRYRERDRHKRRSWGLPERCYGVPAAGGFLLSDWRFHAVDDFVPDVEWASFTDLDSCVAAIQHFLEHFGEARSIAEAAHRRVIAEHTYLHRARKLVSFATAWRDDSRSPAAIQ
jgi:spore maturation protein CgeB